MDPDLLDTAQPHCRGAGTPRPAAARAARSGRGGRLRLASRHRAGCSRCRTVAGVGFDLLQGIERQKRLVLDNTLRFAAGLPANNAMLWGARGMGKSSLVKAVHAAANARASRPPGADRDPSRGHPRRCRSC